ncbi:MAG TPA: DHA2 family efflux MFS transporter permease subunit [Candidatus Gastranaerophilaceae bacterium]|mgnify:CR=1 FL=1|nr:DHA2 family efflux MFS transporter permease subunit [Candidatus Gastranaerophilaceae bacterium]HPT41929.1 DHA2 family efflux MFS transporter permease subunit [Candidatus Gastranaerophilaceae bacterium]
MSENINNLKTEEWKLPENPWPATFAVMIAVFMFVLDSTIANVALPHMAGSFSSSNEEAMWILTSYMIASGIILPSVAWFSGVFGRKNFFIGCVIIFTVSSFLCGLAASLDQMIIARILQGLGGGAIVPVAQAILIENFPLEKRRMAMSVFGVGIIIAPIVGPVLGGWITDNYNWHWIFYINVPIGFLAALMANMFIEDPPFARKKEGQKIDFLGFSFLIIWLVCLQIVLDKGNNADWFNSPWVCWTFAASMLSMVAFGVSQFVNSKSIIDLKVFKDKNFTFGTIFMVLVTAVLYSSIAIMPLFLQNLLRYSAYLSGLSMMPRGVGSVTGLIITGIFAKKIDDRLLIAIGLALMGVSSLMFGFLNLQISMINIIIPNFIFGLGMSCCMIAISTISVVTLRAEQMTNATGVQNLLKNIGGAVGMSIVATFLSRFAQVHQNMMVGNLNPLNPAFQYKVSAMTAAFSKYFALPLAQQKANYLMYVELLKQSSLWAFMDAFRIFGVICFIIMPLLLFMKPHKSNSTEDGFSAMH